MRTALQVLRVRLVQQGLQVLLELQVRLVVLREVPALLVLQGLRDQKGRMVRLVPMALQVLRDLRELQVQPVRLVSMVQQDLQDLRDQLGRLVAVHKDHKARRV